MSEKRDHESAHGHRRARRTSEARGLSVMKEPMRMDLSGVTGISLLAWLAMCSIVLAADVDRGVATGSGYPEVLLVFDPALRTLSPLATDADYKLRRRQLVDVLRTHAESTQRDARAWLDAHGIAYRSYWIANIIVARLSAPAIAELRVRDDILRVEPNSPAIVQLPKRGGLLNTTGVNESIAWGVVKIGSPVVWAAGFTGQSVVIAGEDTGYQWDHPALKNHYRGWNGSAADHNYNWHDAVHDAVGNPCGNDSPVPCDDYGHGTHTAGTFGGGDGSEHQTGVAPGTKWIGCRNMDEGNGTPVRYIECMQWLLAPTDANDENPEPDLAPDIVSNSWGCPASEGCVAGDEIMDAVGNLVAGGVFFVSSAANTGPACGTITEPPATYDASFVVGATDVGDRMAVFSSRGPITGTPLFRPDISAPGVDVPSAWNDGGYAVLSGTSMAAPHVAGAAALLMSVDPSLKGHPDQVAEILRSSTITDGVTDPFNSGCGNLTISQWPNYQAGHGRLDVYAAALLAGMEGTDEMIFVNGFDVTE